MSLGLGNLLVASVLCLISFSMSVVLLLHGRQRGLQSAARIEELARAYRPSRPDVASGGRGLGRKLEAATLLSKVERMLCYERTHQDIYPASPIVIVAIAIVPSAICAFFVAGLIGWVGWAMLPLGAALCCRIFYTWFDDRLVASLYRQFPDALAMIVRAVRVGLPIVEAIRVVARESAQPTAREFNILVSQTTIGVPLEEALRDMAGRNGLPEYRFFATALTLQSQTGGGLTETLENLADTIRKRVEAQLRGHALAAEARMSSYILGALPLVTGTLLSVANPDYMAVLFADPTGRKLLAAAAILLVSGAFIMRIMIRKSLS